MSEIVMSQDQYRETSPAQYRVAYEDDADNVRGKPFTLPAGDANHSDVITGVSSPSTSHLAPKLGQTIRDAEREMLAENAALKATLSRVEALAEEWHWKDPVWLGLGPTGRCDSGQPLLDLLALDKRRGGE